LSSVRHDFAFTPPLFSSPRRCRYLMPVSLPFIDFAEMISFRFYLLPMPFAVA